jgi:threonine dehydratase
VIAIEEIHAAAARLAPHLEPTPLIASPWLSALAGAEVRLKLESRQVTRSFKVRGALNALSRLAERQPRPVVVTASAGNHGRAVAWAAERLGLAAVVFTPRSAPLAKVGPIRAHGADLRPIADDYEGAEVLAMEWAARTGAVFVSPYSHADVIAGGGTVALEVVAAWPEVEEIVVAIGGGGLISGIARLVTSERRRVRVIGVEAEASSAFSAARRAGRIVTIQPQPSLADGLGGNVEPETLTWPYIRDLVREVVTVSEQELAASLRGLVMEEHLIAEGAGIAAVAAAAVGRITLRKAAVVVSGANIDSPTLVRVLTSASQ